MSSDSTNSLEGFVERFLELNGAEVEKKPHGLDALLPEHLALCLNTPEYVHLSTETNVGDKFGIHYGSPLLEKIVDSACDTAPIIGCRLEFNYIKRQGFDRLIRDQFSFYNSVGRVKSAAEVRTEYLLLTCRYLAQSDEQKEGLFELTFNLESGALVPEMSEGFDASEKAFEAESGEASIPAGKIGEILTWIRHRAGRILDRELGPFQDSMNRRFRRDTANLDEYYADLKKEMEASLKRPGMSEHLRSDRKAKIGLIPEELERKKADLFKKYSIRASIYLSGGIRIRMPAVRLLYEASAGRNKKTLSMTYNPATKSMDPLVCDGCGDSTYAIRFCDRLHVLCSMCSGKCPAC